MRGRTMRVHFAHMPGACGLAASHDGRFAISSGSDATIRLHDIRDSPDKAAAWWRAESAEPELPDLSATDLHEKAVGCLAVAPTAASLATGSDDGFVRIFSLKAAGPLNAGAGEMTVEAELVQACARFGGPVRGVDFSPTGAFLAAAGDEPGVLKIVMTAQPTNVTVLRAPSSGKGHEAISTLAFDPNGDFIATVGEKGQAVIWDVEKCKLVSAVELNSRKAKCVGWAPGAAKVVFGTDKGIVVVSRDTWQFDHVLEDAGDNDDDEDEIYAATSGKDLICAVAWSPNGRYLLAAREDSNISLWDVHAKKVLGCWKGQEVVQRIFWHPKANAMVIIDKIGQWGIVPDVVPPHMPSPHSDARTLELPTLPEVEDRPKKKKDLQIDFGDEEEEGNAVKRSAGAKLRRLKQQERKKKAKEAKAAKEAKTKTEAEMTDDEEDNQLENGFTFNPSDVEADDEEELKPKNADDSGESDDESASDEEVPGELAGLENAGFHLPARNSKSRAGSNGVRRARLEPLAQQPFMPTSTPLSEKATKKKHILAWNLVGAVLSFDESTHDLIEIEFADASKRTVGIKDHFGYTMGCLSHIGVLLASPKKKEHGSLITFRPFSSWSNNSDWTQFLPNDENASVIALGQLFAAVATTPNNIIRLFSLSGIQTAVFGIPGTIVTAAASRDKLAIVYAEHHSPVLRCELLDISSVGDVEKVTFSGNLMLCAGSQLEWIGFANDTKELCVYDSKGWVWMMIDPKVGKRWVPMMQNAAKTAKCDWFWVASATSTKIIGAPCLSNERYPQAKPRPALRTLLLSAPVIEKVTKSGKPTIIERFLRTKLKLNRALCAKTDADELYDSDDDEVADAEDEVARMEVEADKCILALMEDACRHEQNMRALDLAGRLHAKLSFKYAIELAKHFKRTALASRVEQVALRKIQVMEEHTRVQPRMNTGMQNSPVTPHAGAQQGSSAPFQDSDEEAAMANERTIMRPKTVPDESRKKLMNFDTDEEEDPPKANVKKADKDPADFGIADVTDDEDEEVVKKTEVVEEPEVVKTPEATPKIREKSSLMKQLEEKREKRKRSAQMPASQASVKGIGNDKTGHVAKKAKAGNSVKAKTSGGASRKFHNRFLKK